MGNFFKSPQILSASLILALGLLWIWFSIPAGGAEQIGLVAAPHKGFLAPDFTLPDSANAQVRLADLRGSLVVVNYWASWCPPCRAEMPAFERAHQEYAGRGVIILGVNGIQQDSLSAAEAFIQENDLSFKILYDTNGAVASLYQISALPTTFFIDREGVIHEVAVGGPLSGAHIQASIEAMLTAALPPSAREGFGFWGQALRLTR